MMEANNKSIVIQASQSEQTEQSEQSKQSEKLDQVINTGIEEGAKYLEVWEDLVSLKALSLSIFVCTALALGGFFLAPDQAPKPLLFGLGGAFLGFIIMSLVIEPKRQVIDEKEEA